MNQVCKWKKKNRIIFNLVTNFLPALRERYLKKYRKSVVKSLSLAIETKNKQWINERPFEMLLWTSDDYEVAQLIVKHKYQDLKDPQPIPVQFSGKLDINDPLIIHLNPALLNSHLSLIHNRDPSKVRAASNELRAKLFKLGKAISSIHLYDNTIFFCYKMVNILNLIENVNKSTGQLVGLRINFVILEQLKVKYQKLKYRYNQIYHIKTKSFEKIQLLKAKLVEFEATSDKFTHEYCIFLTPTFSNKKVTLLNSEIEEFRQKQIM